MLLWRAGSAHLDIDYCTPARIDTIAAGCLLAYLADQPESRRSLARLSPGHASVAFALNKMSVDGYRHIPIVEDGQAVGVLSIKDIVNFVVEFFPERVLNLPDDPKKAITQTVDGG